MLQQRVIKQKAYELILARLKDSREFLTFVYSRADYSEEVLDQMQKIIEEEKERIQNKLNKITLRPKNEISNGSSIS